MPLVADVHPVHAHRCLLRRNGTIRYLIKDARIPRNDLPVHVGGRVRGLWWTATTFTGNTGVGGAHESSVLGFTPRLDVLYTFPITL